MLGISDLQGRLAGRNVRTWVEPKSRRIEVLREGVEMERIYDRLEHILQLWKTLELTKPNTTEHTALMNQIRVLSDEYRALIDSPKKPRKSK